MKETTIKRNFSKWLDNLGKPKNTSKALSTIIPKSIKSGSCKIKEVKYNSLVGKEIVAKYDKCANCIWLLVKKINKLKTDKKGNIINYDHYWDNWCIYEIFMIESERVCSSGIIRPTLYKLV